ncbi:hypothetical protein JRQ81_011904 [Phrynocephalus forsythii]|uniref:TFIIS N-terminal domain-containing protein n=1 Tax=Phrynocephalus forsythii TaxID=171643 RepID=A0A9Q0X7L5_9SAUR|nr:hypothetical protein JRQ81_011904 [Phrynocephalus forsythii]
MAESVLEVVGKLQSRLSGGSEPKKLLKSLKRLSELPITVDILLETGVGKTVNSLRKHEQVGDFAKNLVARWKKLVPVPPETERHSLEAVERSYDRSVPRKRHREPSPPEDDEAEPGYPEAYQPSGSQVYDTDHGIKKAKRYAEPERALPPVSYGAPDARTWGRHSPVLSDQECSDYGQAASPEPSESPQELYMDLCPPEDQERETKSLGRKANKGHGFSDRQEGSHGRPLGDSQDKGSSARSKEHRSSHKEKQRAEAKGEEQGPPFNLPRLHKGSSKEPSGEASLTSSGSKERPKASLDGSKREKKREGSGIKKEKPPVDLEEVSEDYGKKQKLADPERAKPEKTKLGTEVAHGEPEKRKPERDSASKKGKKVKPKAPESHKRTAGFSPPNPREGEVEDEYEKPTMSFESYLSYDQPQKKKKKVAKPPAPVPEKDKGQGKQNGSKSNSKSAEASRKPHKQAGEKKPSGSSKPKKIVFDVVPTLPDIPLPPIQANYRPLPSLESIPQPSQRGKRCPLPLRKTRLASRDAG